MDGSTYIQPIIPKRAAGLVVPFVAPAHGAREWRSIYEVAKAIIKDLDDAILAGRVKLD